MKNSVVVITVLLLVSFSYSKDDDNDLSCDNIVQNQSKSEELKLTGTVFITTGAAILCVGLLMASNSQPMADGNSSVGANVGGLLIDLSGPVIIPGIICAIVGRVHKRKYDRLYNDSQCYRVLRENKSIKPSTEEPEQPVRRRFNTNR